MREAVHISRAEDKTPAELKRVLAEFVLVMAGCAGPLPAYGIVFAKKMEQIGRAEFRSLIGLALVVYQERKLDSRFLAKYASVVGVTQADGGQRSSLVPEGPLVFAQLRDMFAAEDSAVMAEKDKHCGPAGPERPEPDFIAIRVGKHNFPEPAAEGLFHCCSILRSTLRVVKLHCPASDLAHLPSEQ